MQLDAVRSRGTALLGAEYDLGAPGVIARAVHPADAIYHRRLIDGDFAPRPAIDVRRLQRIADRPADACQHDAVGFARIAAIAAPSVRGLIRQTRAKAI